MASDPQGDRIRLVIEPGEDEPKITGGEYGQTSHQHFEDNIDLGRLDDDLDYEFEDEENPPARRRILPLGLVGLALAGFGAISWYAYQGVIGSIDEENIPLIQADATPIKSRPVTPGGIEVPYRDKLVLNDDLTPDPDKPLVERLLPPPEVPKPPKKQRVVTALPQAPDVPAPDAQAKTDGIPKGELALAPVQKTPKKELSLKPAAGTAPPKVTPPLKAIAAPTQPKPKAEADLKAPQTTQTAAIQGGYLVQLASLKQKKLAGGEWVRLQKTFPKLLAGKKLVLQEADLGSRGVFHRVRAGYFPDKKSAAALCQALKAKNQACIVVKL